MKNLFIVSLMFFSVLIGKGQSISISDFHTGKIVSGDTIRLQFVDNGFHGWQSLNIELKIKNTTSPAKEVGVRKTEYATMLPGFHSICFAGTCYDEKTFESPSHSMVNAGATDSSFSGHYIYNDTVCLPGKRLVSYTFYDVNNASDSSSVYVLYNTVVSVGIKGGESSYQLSIYPNPAGKQLTIEGLSISGSVLSLYDVLGKEIWNRRVIGEPLVTVDVAAFVPGMYWLRVGNSTHKILVE